MAGSSASHHVKTVHPRSSSRWRHAGREASLFHLRSNFWRRGLNGYSRYRQ